MRSLTSTPSDDASAFCTLPELSVEFSAAAASSDEPVAVNEMVAVVEVVIAVVTVTSLPVTELIELVRLLVRSADEVAFKLSLLPGVIVISKVTV